MLDAYLAARELERMKAEQSAEFARQLPLHAEEIADRPDPENGEAPRAAPDWTANY